MDDSREKEVNQSVSEKTDNKMVGGTLKDIAGKTLTDKNYQYLFDENTRAVVDVFTRTNPILEKVPLTALDHLRLSERWEDEMIQPTEMSKGMSVDKISEKVSNHYSIYEHKNNQINNNKMEQQTEFDKVQYLKNQMKYHGFGESEKLHADLEKGIAGDDNKFEIKTSSDRAMPGNKADFTLKFNKSDKGGVFFNSFDAELTKKSGEKLKHSFKVNNASITAKEAINLLEGRSVKTQFKNQKTEEMEPVFIKLKLKEDKNEYGNYKMEYYNKGYGVDTKDIVEKSPLVFSDSDNYDAEKAKDFVIKSLEKGNIVKTKMNIENKETEGFAVLNPQYKNIQLYDNNMSRINTNKPIKGIENPHEKSNAKEQSISRSI